MVSIEQYRIRIGLFRGGRHFNPGREEGCDVSGSRSDYYFVLSCCLGLLGLALTIFNFHCAIVTNEVAFGQLGAPRCLSGSRTLQPTISTGEVNWGQGSGRCGVVTPKGGNSVIAYGYSRKGYSDSTAYTLGETTQHQCACTMLSLIHI